MFPFRDCDGTQVILRSSDTFPQFAEVLQNDSRVQSVLCTFRFDVACAKALSDALKSTQTVRELCLSGCLNTQLDDDLVVETDSNGRPIESELHVKLKDKPGTVYDRPVLEVCKALRSNMSIVRVDLSGNTICWSGATALADVLRVNRTITSLNLCGALGLRRPKLTLSTPRALFNRLVKSRSIHSPKASGGADLLFPSKEGVDEEVLVLAHALGENTALLELDLSYNFIGCKGNSAWRALANALSNNTALTTLKLTGNYPSPEGLQCLVDAMMVNTTLLRCDLTTANTTAATPRTASHRPDTSRKVSAREPQQSDTLDALLRLHMRLKAIKSGVKLPHRDAILVLQQMADAGFVGGIRAASSLGSALDDRGTPFGHLAVLTGRMALLKWAVKHGALNLNREDDHGDTALHLALRIPNTSIAMFLIDSMDSEGLNHPNDNTQHTPLHVAVENGLEEVVVKLVNRDIEVDSPDMHGNTPLHTAISRNLASIADTLVRAGASLMARNKDGITPYDLSNGKASDRPTHRTSLSQRSATFAVASSSTSSLATPRRPLYSPPNTLLQTPRSASALATPRGMHQPLWATVAPPTPRGRGAATGTYANNNDTIRSNAAWSLDRSDSLAPGGGGGGGKSHMLTSSANASSVAGPSGGAGSWTSSSSGGNGGGSGVGGRLWGNGPQTVLEQLQQRDPSTRAAINAAGATLRASRPSSMLRSPSLQIAVPSVQACPTPVKHAPPADHIALLAPSASPPPPISSLPASPVTTPRADSPSNVPSSPRSQPQDASHAVPLPTPRTVASAAPMSAASHLLGSLFFSSSAATSSSSGPSTSPSSSASAVSTSSSTPSTSSSPSPSPASMAQTQNNRNTTAPETSAAPSSAAPAASPPHKSSSIFAAIGRAVFVSSRPSTTALRSASAAATSTTDTSPTPTLKPTLPAPLLTPPSSPTPTSRSIMHPAQSLTLRSRSLSLLPVWPPLGPPEDEDKDGPADPSPSAPAPHTSRDRPPTTLPTAAASSTKSPRPSAATAAASEAPTTSQSHPQRPVVSVVTASTVRNSTGPSPTPLPSNRPSNSHPPPISTPSRPATGSSPPSNHVMTPPSLGRTKTSLSASLGGTSSRFSAPPSHAPSLSHGWATTNTSPTISPPESHPPPVTPSTPGPSPSCGSGLVSPSSRKWAVVVPSAYRSRG